MMTKAGEGEHRYYILYDDKPKTKDTVKLEVGKHYLGVDAVHWYVNKQGNILTRKMASGTVKLSLGEEEYAAGLGRYILGKGAYTAPVFNKVILPNRAYRGGELTIRTFVRVIESDTLLSKLLRDMALASVTMIAGAVGAATVAGPSAILLKAGTSFTNGIEDILKQGQRGLTIFDPGGLQVTLPNEELKSKYTYLLVHRGAELERKRLYLRKTKNEPIVYYKGKRLLDGAWILYRLRREYRCKISRPWQEEAQKFRGELRDLISDRKQGSGSQEEACNALDPDIKYQPNLASDFFNIRSQIRSDYVLTENEMNIKIDSLDAKLKEARVALKC